MSNLLEKCKPFAVVAAVTLVLAHGAVSAASFCGTPACYEPAPIVSTPMCTSCAGNPSLAPLARTNLPGTYSNDYDYAVTARTPIGINYLVPTQGGLVETPVIPLTNPVDRYYATHRVMNGQVVDDSAAYQMALSTPILRQIQGNMAAGSAASPALPAAQNANATMQDINRNSMRTSAPATMPEPLRSPNTLKTSLPVPEWDSATGTFRTVGF